MSKEKQKSFKKSSNKKDKLLKITLATALINLLTVIIGLIIKMLDWIGVINNPQSPHLYYI